VSSTDIDGLANSLTQILTHGLGYNRTYWDFYVPGSSDPSFSHVYAATAAGYSTLSWNRLGITPSTIADPYTEVQGLPQAQLLIALTQMARAGKIPGMKTPPKHIINVGHSFGSQLTVGMAALAPDVSDAVVLTGINGDTSGIASVLGTSWFRLANEFEPERFPKQTYSNGWLTWATASDNQFSFFWYPNFKPEVLATAEAVKHPFTLGEIFGGGLLPQQAPAFKKPVLFLASEHDAVCRFDCSGDFDVDGPAYARFNGTKDIEVFMVPGAGHALPLHTNVTVGYEALDAWIQKRFPSK
jgi:pimeloyl-ACP methyl ester carboxylesterase